MSARFSSGSLADPRPRVRVVVVAAGAGRRFGDAGGARKQYRELGGRPLLAWALRPFVGHPAVVQTIVVLPADDVETPPDWLAPLPVLRVAGGAERSDSVRSGLDALGGGCDLVLVHDGARPLVSRTLLDRILASAAGCGCAVVPGLPVTDTLKEVGPDGFISGTPDRSRFWRVQTPQAFPLDTLRDAHRRASLEGLTTTDDAALCERYGVPVRVVEGDPANIKVTTVVDLALAEVLAHRLPDFDGLAPRR
jgi:2-C-methyl-D-erythritol 4-phosphate cytidylyltransferase